MRKLLLALLLSLFLGTGVALAGGGYDVSPQQQSAPQGKIVVNVPDNGNDWVGPAIGAVGAIAAAGIGLYAVRSRRKED